MNLIHSISTQLRSILLGNEVIGVEAQMDSHGVANFHAVCIKSNGKSLMLKNSITTNSLENLSSFVRQTPVVLCLTGKGIITKSKDENDHADLKQLMPGLNLESLMIKEYSSENKRWYCITKKEFTEFWIQQFRAYKITVVDIELGGSSILLHPEILTRQPVNIGHHNFQWQGHDLVDYQFKATAELDSGEIHNKLALPLDYVIPGIISLKFFGFAPFLEIKSGPSILQNFLWSRFKKVYAVGFASIVFVLLVFNLWLRHSLTKSLEVLQAEIESVNFQIQQNTQNNEETLFDRQLSDQLSGLNVPTYAERLECTARLIPAEIVVSEFEIHQSVKPQSKAAKDAFPFDKHVMSLSGTSRNLDAINNLIAGLQNEPWVKEVKLQHLQLAKGSTDQAFKLILTI
jgi:Tfp pilus assembly protein PilN